MGEPEGVLVALVPVEAVFVGVAVGEGVGVALPVALCDAGAEGVACAVPVALSEGRAEGEVEELTVPVLHGEGRGEGVGEGREEGEGERDELAVPVAQAEVVGLDVATEAEAVRLCTRDALLEAEAVAVGVSAADAVPALPLAVAVGEEAGVGVPRALAELQGVAAAEGVEAGLALPLAVERGEGVEVAVRAGDEETCTEEVLVMLPPLAEVLGNCEVEVELVAMGDALESALAVTVGCPGDAVAEAAGAVESVTL